MQHPYIIAEVGINHNGSRALAINMVEMAAECGCDAVKFQKRDIHTVYDEEFLLSHRKSPWGETQLEQKEGLELTTDDYCAIRERCDELGIDFGASAWDLQSLTFVEGHYPRFHKIASAMLTNYEFVDHVARLGRHTFVSTGMSTEPQIDKALEILKKRNCEYTLMHCVSAYPCPPCDCNLKVIRYLAHRYQRPAGYSDHSSEVWIPPLAVALGAVAIEIHITLNRKFYGSDQSASFERGGVDRVVKWCREVAEVLGDGEKRVLPREMEASDKLRYWRNEVS